MSPFDDDDKALPYGKELIELLKEKAPRAAMALAAIQAASPGVKYVRTVYRARRLYTVRVQGGIHADGLYEEMHEWVLNQLPPQKRRAVIAYAPPSGSRRAIYDPEDGGFVQPQVTARLRLRYDGTRTQPLTVRGFKVRVTANDGSAVGPDGKAVASPEICFSVYSPGARDALLLEIEEILQASLNKARKAPSFRMLNKWDEWNKLNDLPARPLESVILPDGQLEKIAADIQRFLDSEAEYNRRCIPWHRGHFYTGLPGTGKTSTAQAIAGHFGLDMWYLPLSDVKKDSDLISHISGIRGRSVLLLEDVDTYHAATSRDDFGGTTLSGLLNSLDGIVTPHGLITIMTANHPEMLDSAVLRKGRADLTEKFSLSGADEAARLISRWYSEDCPRIRADLQMSASDISEICKSSDSAMEAARVLNEG